MLTRSRYYQPVFRINRLQSEEKVADDPYDRSYYLSPQPSLDANKLKYKLVSPLKTNITSVSNRISRQDTRRFMSKLDPIDRDIT